MKLHSLSITELLPAPYNPRRPLKPGDDGWARLERSLTEFELVQPIVWNKLTGHVVSGHQRLEVLKHHGHTHVDAIVVDLELEREKALNVTLNNRTVGSDWDTGKLIDLVSELQDLPDFDATLTGFDDQQLKDLIFAPDPECLPEDEPMDTDHIQISLSIPQDAWEAVRAELDNLLVDHPSVRLHTM